MSACARGLEDVGGSGLRAVMKALGATVDVSDLVETHEVVARKYVLVPYLQASAVSVPKPSPARCRCGRGESSGSEIRRGSERAGDEYRQMEGLELGVRYGEHELLLLLQERPDGD